MKRTLASLSLFLAVLAFAPVVSRAADAWKPNVGLQTWTCRNMSFEGVVEFAKKHGITHLQMIAKHIDPNASREDWAKKKAVLEANGLTCYTFGVAGTSEKTEDNRKLFEMAKFLGCKLIIVEPKNEPAVWDSLESLVKEYDIKLAIHNHGHSSVYGTPEKVWSVLKDRDQRIGVCVDIGHISGAGFDVAQAFVDYKGRVYDLHLKDKKVEKADGKDVILDVEVGTGIANYKGLFAELRKANWQGVMAIETDNQSFANEPTAFVTAAQKFVKESTSKKK